MLLWTVVPEEIIMDGMDKPREYRKVRHMEKDMVVELGEDGKKTVVQLLSTDPFDFLASDFSPGKEI